MRDTYSTTFVRSQWVYNFLLHGLLEVEGGDEGLYWPKWSASVVCLRQTNFVAVAYTWQHYINIFDSLTDPVVHLLLLKSSMGLYDVDMKVCVGGRGGVKIVSQMFLSNETKNFACKILYRNLQREN